MSTHPPMKSSDPRFKERIKVVQRALAFTGDDVDGDLGHNTLSRIEDKLGIAQPVETTTPPVIPPVLTPSGPLPTPQAQYAMPAESNASMTAFYGAPSPEPSYLTWFSFPDHETRLYERGGTLLSNRAGDERLDHKCHQKIADRLQNALAEIYQTLGQQEFRRQGWNLYGGCHNYRKKVGGSSLSTHSWGIAIDIAPDENPYAQTSTKFSAAAIDIMEKWGFLSGGRAWGKDWMHFQAVIPNISSGSYYAKNGLPKNIIRA